MDVNQWVAQNFILPDSLPANIRSGVLSLAQSAKFRERVEYIVRDNGPITVSELGRGESQGSLGLTPFKVPGDPTQGYAGEIKIRSDAGSFAYRTSDGGLAQVTLERVIYHEIMHLYLNRSDEAPVIQATNSFFKEDPGFCRKRDDVHRAARSGSRH